MIQSVEKIDSITHDPKSVVLDVRGFSTAIINITGTFVGTVIFEYTIDNTNWNTLSANIIGSSTQETGATAAGKWRVNVAGFLKVRVRCSAYTSGTMAVTIRAVNSSMASGASGEGSGLASSANTPSIATAATAIAANAARKGWMIQNVGTNPLFVRLGADGSITVFHMILKGGTGDNDGLGASYEQREGVIYTGIITIAGTSPKYVVTEL